MYQEYLSGGSLPKPIYADIQKQSAFQKGFGFYTTETGKVVRAKFMFDSNRNLLPEWQKVAQTGAIWDRNQYLAVRKNLGLSNQFKSVPDYVTSEQVVNYMRDAGIALSDPTAKERILNAFPIREEIEFQDKILNYEKENNLITVTPPRTGFSLSPLIIAAVVGLLALR